MSHDTKPETKSRVSKTTITFTVFHRTDDNPFTGDETWGEYDNPYDGPLGLAMREAWDGSMVGMESDPVTVPVPEEQLEAALRAIGNDGEFFDLESECTCLDPERAGGNRADGSHWIACPVHDEQCGETLNGVRCTQPEDDSHAHDWDLES